jgi:non-ribosomal peptide synthetase-like protein
MVTSPGQMSPGELCLQEVFEWRAGQQPDAVALECGTRRWTYAELDRRSTRLARMLRGYGAGPGRFVALHLGRSDEAVAAILACHKSGAAYVPIDPMYPGERIRRITDELGPVVCLTDGELKAKAEAHFGGSRLLVLGSRAVAARLTCYDDTAIGRDESGLSPSDLAYVIYTSGATGRPKGVMAEHGAVCRYVQAFNEVCGTGVQDRVFQGCSLSFDSSVEEIWMAFSNGSTLVVPTRHAPRFGEELGGYLDRHRITYLSTVATVLSTLGEDVPSLRTIVLSGEACPPELVSRWARRGRRLLSVYGPTEATVNTTAAECRPGGAVTIGRPLTGYGLHVVDEHLRPSPRGQLGELLISGPTLARGYVRQPELTREQFLDDDRLRDLEGVGRCYRTGDLVRWTEDGELELHGRIDAQVKILGYRVELTEIESVLAEHPQVRRAAVHLVEREGLQVLAACVVPERAGTGSGEPDLGEPDLGEPDRASLLALLDARLPGYMVPGYLDTVAELPLTISGELDRRRLPAPSRSLIRPAAVAAMPKTDLEHRIAQVWQEVLGVGEVSVEDDFFRDLGGYSLVAARMVTRLRQVLPLDVTVRDVYECPTVRGLGNRLEQRTRDGAAACSAGQVRSAPSAGEVFDRMPRGRRAATHCGQALSIYLLTAVPAIPLALLLVVLRGWATGALSVQLLVVVWLAVPLLLWPVMLVVSIAAKWVLIGRYRPGDHPLWGWFYLRWWLCRRLQALSGVGGLAGTPLLPLYFRLMGAEVGPGCTLDTAQVVAWDLVSIGADTSIGAGTQLLGYRVEDGMLRFGRVEIGSRCFVGIHSALGLGVRMQDDSGLDDQSLLPDGDVIPAGEGRRGSPARPATLTLPTLLKGRKGRQPGLPSRSRARRILFGLVHLMAAEVLGVLLVVSFALFAATCLWAFSAGGVSGLLLMILVVVPPGVVASCLIVAALRRLVLPRIRPGTYPVESLLYVRKWLSDGIMRAARTAFLPVSTTIYLPPWLRAMGAKIGPGAEMSTIGHFAPESVEVGPGSFIADGSIIGGRRTFRGGFQVDVNRIGWRSFVGNGAVLPVGAGLGDGCLLGVQSVTPTSANVVPDGSEWLGSPPFPLNARPKIGGFDDTVTFHPTRRLYLLRAVTDGLRVLLPGYLAILGLVGYVALVFLAVDRLGPAAALWLAPVAGLLVELGMVLTVVAIKRAVMGTCVPVVKPLWCGHVRRNEMVNGLFGSVMAPMLVSLLGTPFVAPLMRLMGCRIGRHTYLATTLMSEFDLVEVGDHAALNEGVVLQTHLFEDRIFKSSVVRVGPEASIGNMAVVLYDTMVGRAAAVGPLSLLMKGETLVAGSRWYGIPTEQHGIPTEQHGAAARGLPPGADGSPARSEST